jgi:Golgi phosphoprotein 3 (GPP34)
MVTLIAEDLLLLMLDDASGKLTGTSYPQPALGGALLVELALAGAVEIEEKSGFWKSAKVRPAPGAAPQDEVLRAGYDLVAEKERSAQDLVDRLGKGLKERLADRLVGRGVLDRQEDKVVGLFPRTRWPSADATHEDQVRRALTAVLVSGAEPDQRTGALVAILSAIDKAHKVVDHQGMSSRDVRKRAKQIGEGAWAAKAVRDAISASVAAIGAVAAGAAIGTSSS